MENTLEEPQEVRRERQTVTKDDEADRIQMVESLSFIMDLDFPMGNET